MGRGRASGRLRALHPHLPRRAPGARSVRDGVPAASLRRRVPLDPRPGLADVRRGPLHGDGGDLRRRARAASRRGARGPLADVVAALGEEAEIEERLQTLAGILAHRIGDLCAIDVADADGRLEMVANAASEPELERAVDDLRRRASLPPDDPRGMAGVSRTGEASLVPEVTPELLEAYVRAAGVDAGSAAAIRRRAPRSIIVAPLPARGRTLGALLLVTYGDRRLGGGRAGARGGGGEPGRPRPGQRPPAPREPRDRRASAAAAGGDGGPVVGGRPRRGGRGGGRAGPRAARRDLGHDLRDRGVGPGGARARRAHRPRARGLGARAARDLLARHGRGPRAAAGLDREPRRLAGALSRARPGGGAAGLRRRRRAAARGRGGRRGGRGARLRRGPPLRRGRSRHRARDGRGLRPGAGAGAAAAPGRDRAGEGRAAGGGVLRPRLRVRRGGAAGAAGRAAGRADRRSGHGPHRRRPRGRAAAGGGRARGPAEAGPGRGASTERTPRPIRAPRA